MPYLGRGIYDVKEIARLLNTGPARVTGWVSPRSARPALLEGQLGGLFSFWDLISLRVIAELTHRRVPRRQIVRGAEHLSRALGTDRPFAHEDLATVGKAFFAQLSGDWEDVGLGGQLAFQTVIGPLINPITYNDKRMASIWRPHRHVWINPAVQAGAPCIEGTRVPTQLIAGLVGNDSSIAEIENIADDYCLTRDQVTAALDYELAPG